MSRRHECSVPILRTRVPDRCVGGFAYPAGIKAWRDVWSGGHGVGLIIDTPTVAAIVGRLCEEYEAAKGTLRAFRRCINAQSRSALARLKRQAERRGCPRKDLVSLGRC